mmetsp:Transcript_17581/g.53826  ORF Transcript_17581/g.53826 Transcript_17581/m.53826 type:complete len:105 (-) Transcript_17581:465-779(-)|eukprot:CAMPEP_0118877484 /NCGR_PEP_ID=MMETSP1163-20130328/17765_1 /TAXON_ID=124430 /ORGANISM="Phaeomonas parva, Strain CCMP2877" /LENGTH=104 /DNA_ID=CAMNT_0006813201 /DNA_START=105 /DNA_END=419 /DNA_ORIENTATION=-
MPKRDPEDRDAAAATATTTEENVEPSAKRAKETNDNGEAYFELSNKRRVTVRAWNKKPLIDIREYYEHTSGEMRPGKKGISLTAEQWAMLKDFMAEIDAAVEEL